MVNADQSKALVRRFYDEVCNAKNLGIADELYSPDHKVHDPLLQMPIGPKGIKQMIGMFQKAFDNARWSIEEMHSSADGEMVTVRWIGSGTHTGELMGIQPTRKPVEVTGMTLFRIRGNRIVESWNSWDTLGMLQQIGAIQPTVLMA